jgi:putative nucleotidyltransferase with HDIG domain
MNSLVTEASVTAARDVAESLLSGLPERWCHTMAVAARAAQLATTVAEADRDMLVAAAWLHDVGYGEAAVDTGFHPLDGARLLRREGWPHRLTCLVAHHSGADYVAAARGILGLTREFPHEHSPVSDALTYADQTTGPTGQPVTMAERMADMLRRHGPDSANARAQPLRERYLLAVAGRVEARLSGDPRLSQPGRAAGGSGRAPAPPRRRVLLAHP